MPNQPARSLQDLYRQYRGELEGMLYKKTGCREAAADLCQEAFSHVCRVDDLGKINNLKAYLYRTAMNLLCDYLRSKQLSGATVIEWPQEGEPESTDDRSPEIAAMADQECSGLLAALAELPPLCRRIFYLNRFEGMKQRDIAQRLNISVRSVESNIKRALVHCAKALAKN